MRSLIKKILSNKFALLLRNTLKIKPVRISKYYSDKNVSMSDAFLFRTDNNFSSILRFVDIPNIFLIIKILILKFSFMIIKIN